MIFVDARLDDRIHRASLFAEAAVDALEQVDVVARGAADAVGGDIRVDGDGQCRADRLAQLAGDAALLAVGVAAQRMQPAEAHRLRRLLLRVLHRHLAPEQRARGHRQPLQQLGEQKGLEGIRYGPWGSPGTDVVTEHGRLDRDPHQRDRNQDLPTQAHDLVVAIAREGGSQPQEDAQQQENLDDQPVRSR